MIVHAGVLDYRAVVVFRRPFDIGNKFVSNSEAVSSAAQHQVTIRPALESDLLGIAQCIEPFVVSGKVLPRTLHELEGLIPEYVVAVAGEVIVGCAVLEIYSKKLAEIRSLVVSPDFQKLGLGKLLVEACIERAKAEEILEVMAITSREDFFLSCGFDFTLPGEKKALFYVASPHLLMPGAKNA